MRSSVPRRRKKRRLRGSRTVVEENDSLWFWHFSHSLTTHSFAFVCQSNPFLGAGTLFFCYTAALFCLGASVSLFGCAADGRVLVILYESLIRWWMMHVCVCAAHTHSQRTHSHMSKIEFLFKFLCNKSYRYRSLINYVPFWLLLLLLLRSFVSCVNRSVEKSQCSGAHGSQRRRRQNVNEQRDIER